MPQANAQGFARVSPWKLFAIMLVVALVAAMTWLAPSSARADDLTSGDTASSSEVAVEPDNAVDTAAPVDAAPAAPVEEAPAEPAPAPVVEPAAPVQEEVVEPSVPEQPAAPATDSVEVAPADVVIAEAPVITAVIFQSSDCVIGLFAAGDTEGFQWSLTGPGGEVIVAPSPASGVGSDATLRVPITVAGEYSASVVYTLGATPEVQPVGTLNATCVVPVGQPYVDLSNLAVTTEDPLSAVVSFDYDVRSGAGDREVFLEVIPAGSTDSVESRTVSVTGEGTATELFDLPAGDYTVNLVNVVNCGGDCDGRDVVLSEDFTVWEEVVVEPTIGAVLVPSADGKGVEFAVTVELGSAGGPVTVIITQKEALVAPELVFNDSGTLIGFFPFDCGTAEFDVSIKGTDIGVTQAVTIPCPPQGGGGGGELPSSGDPDPVTPPADGNNGTGGGNSSGDGNNSGTTGTSNKSVKTDTLAATGGESPLGVTLGASALVVLGAALMLLRRRVSFGATSRG